MPRRPIKIGTYAFQWPEPSGKTIAEGQRFMQEVLLTGAEDGSCPCCGRPCIGYKVKLSRDLVIFLWHLVNRYLETRDWVPLDWFSFGNKKNVDPRTLEGWGLAVFRTEGKRAECKPTKEGYDFVKGKLQVPTHTFVFSNKVFAFAETVIGARESVGVAEWNNLTKSLPKKRILKTGEGEGEQEAD